MIRILAVVDADEDRRRLLEIARGKPWRIGMFGHAAEAARSLRTGEKAAVIVIDTAEWRQALAELHDAAPGAAIAVAGAAQWNEVVEAGGYDVLAKPFAAAEVARCILHGSWFAESREGGNGVRK